VLKYTYPKVGEVWLSDHGKRMRVMDTGDPNLWQSRRKITLASLVEGASTTITLRALLRWWSKAPPLGALTAPRIRPPSSPCPCGTCTLCVARACGW